MTLKHIPLYSDDCVIIKTVINDIGKVSQKVVYKSDIKRHNASASAKRAGRKYETSIKGKAHRKAYTQSSAGREVIKRKNHKRRGRGYIPLNKSFDGCNGHHIDMDNIIHIPSSLHRAVQHSVVHNKNMFEANRLAFTYLMNTGGI